MKRLTENGTSANDILNYVRDGIRFATKAADGTGIRAHDRACLVRLVAEASDALTTDPVERARVRDRASLLGDLAAMADARGFAPVIARLALLESVAAR